MTRCRISLRNLAWLASLLLLVPACSAGSGGEAADDRVEGIPAPQKGTAQLDGLYMRVEYVGGNLDKQFFLFTPSGYFSRLPQGGIDPYDFTAEAKKHPDAVGTYVIQGNKLTVHYVNGKTAEMKYEVTKDGVELDGLYAYKAPRYKIGRASCRERV